MVRYRKGLHATKPVAPTQPVNRAAGKCLRVVYFTVYGAAHHSPRDCSKCKTLIPAKGLSRHKGINKEITELVTGAGTEPLWLVAWSKVQKQQQ